ncbi:protein of unknown function [Jatrophihabitans endophyticus]|uniref:Shedu protein SduA C-terminal domain-containing protein n=1 Tax=Jatrophihabitans endophyticus TaxID=1206085 RepID=A0A1M5HB11_9ACTN|nr:Shedu anti-phage system protein SduA domain-containing protein [Jatrophihabitans endophyticus]SHG13165.1 protein of unknown function [Jatrophihabitans endophyticus]
MEEDREDNLASAFHAWTRDQSSNPRVLRTEGVEIYRGPQVYKSATLRTFGDRDAGSVSRTELRFGSYRRKDFEPGYDFDHPDRTWHCNDEQIDRVRALLNGDFLEDGYYLRVERGSSLSGLAEAMRDGAVDAESIADLIAALAAVPGVTEALASTDLVQFVTGAVEREKQRAGIARLQSAVEDSDSSEQDLQSILEDHWWMFGGRYVSAAARRKLTLLDQFDIPLIRADGALHVVELKKAYIPRLVIEHRNHVALGPDVHFAVSQAQNYLAALDRQETVIRSEFGLDCRRAFATVVVGHPMHCTGFDSKRISEALRIYNGHLSRVEVITYEELIHGASRSIAITSEED